MSWLKFQYNKHPNILLFFFLAVLKYCNNEYIYRSLTVEGKWLSGELAGEIKNCRAHTLFFMHLPFNFVI